MHTDVCEAEIELPVTAESVPPSGPKFEIARTLKERGVPFVFMTGYDPDAIPAELEDAPRLQKPVPFRRIVEAVSQL